MDVDFGREALAKLVEELPDLGDMNEADTRFHLIDRVLLECLQWPSEAISVEKRYDGKYADYTLSQTARAVIVEAKRSGKYFELPVGKGARVIGIPTLFTGSNTKDALAQCASYCQTRGAAIAVITNGGQWVAFLASRTDGVPPLEGKALVYRSLEEMLGNWAETWNLLSPEGVRAGNLAAQLTGMRLASLPPKLSTTIVQYPGVKNRNPFQTDLQIVSELVIEDVVRNRALEETFLRECYSASGALSQYSLVSKSVLLARYAALQNDGRVTPLPAVTKKGINPEIMSDSLKKRPTLLVGDVGVGKTMFVRHLIKVDAKEVLEKSITLYVDLGSQATFTHDIVTFIPQEITRQLESVYGINICESGFVNAVYHKQLESFSKGIYAELKELDRVEYAHKKAGYLESLVGQEVEHLQLSLQHIVSGRRQPVVIFVDNVDQRDPETQQQAFLMAHEMADRWPASVFLALRPETYYRSLRSGALTGYHPKAFTISPPRILDVVEKRLRFALQLTRGEVPLEGVEIGLSLPTLATLIEAFLNSLKTNKELALCIENIAGGNVRLVLEQVRDFFGSGHVDTEKIVRIQQETKHYIVPIHEFLRAILYGDAEYYDPSSSALPNLFDVATPDKREHFLLLLLLGRIQTKSAASAEHAAQTDVAVSGLQDLGFTGLQVEQAVRRAWRSKLIDSPSDIEVDSDELPAALRLTSLGAYALDVLPVSFSYLDAVIVDTPILDSSVRKSVFDARSIEQRVERARLFVQYLAACWESMDCPAGCGFDWPECQRTIEAELDRIAERVSTNSTGQASQAGSE